MRTVKVGPFECEIVETDDLPDGTAARVHGTQISIQKVLPSQEKDYHLAMSVVGILDSQHNLNLSDNKKRALCFGLISLLKDNTSILGAWEQARQAGGK